jgi:hypothetical protein
VILVLCVRTAGQAVEVEDGFMAAMLLGAGALASVWGVGFILWKESESAKPHRQGRNYYAGEEKEEDLLKDDAYRFLGFIRPSPIWIPLVAVAGILLVRALFVFDPESVACHALAGISFSFALWTCVLNRLALNSLRSRVPWVTAIVVVIAIFAGLGFTQNHGMLAGDALTITGSGAASLRHMFWWSLLLALGAVLAYVLWTRFFLRMKAERRMLGAWLLVLGWTCGVMYLASRGQGDTPVVAIKRPTLAQAVTVWLQERKKECEAEGCDTIPVYLVSSEGGGIRAAYYTARLMSELSAVGELKLSRRVFSLSGVSGGSVGITAWRLCLDAAGVAPVSCVTPLGSQDLLTPLSSAWLFEDSLALLLPTSQCTLPGCGFIDRASWFERSLENALPQSAGPMPVGAPYLLLNATWVETGERSIASNLQIESERCVKLRQRAVAERKFDAAESWNCRPEFPTARDQVFELGAPARASTLAHNSARFPYFNPIGYMRGIGHLADGGYFDNSGTQTTADVLNEFARQLTCDSSGCPPEDQADTHERLSSADIAFLRDKVAITALMIRNGVHDTADPAETNCAAPRAAPEQNLFANAAGPLITALKATGIGTPNRVAQCNLQRLLNRLNGKLARQQGNGGYVDVRLVTNKTLYPLGWYLSVRARRGIDAAVMDCVHGSGLKQDLAGSPPTGAKAGGLSCYQRVVTGAQPAAPPTAP